MDELKTTKAKADVEKIKTKIKKMRKVFLIIVIGFILGFITCFMRFKQIENNAKNELKPMTDNVQVITRHIVKALENSSELITAKYTYQAVDIYETSKEFKGVKVPFTKNKVVYVYDGVVKAGIDLSDVTFDVSENEKKIIINLPAVRIDSSEVDEESFEYPYEDYSIWNKPNMKDYVDLINALEEKKKTEMENDSEFLSEARNNAKKVLTGMIKSLDIIAEYEIVYK